MDNGIHFISGLPRSGSTLLAALLRQNPRFHANMSSPVAAIYNHVMQAMAAQNDYSVFIDDDQREEVLRGIFTSFYSKLHREKTVFDTNRLWCSRLPALTKLFPEAWVIACVREPAWILDSFERLTRKSPFLNSKMVGPSGGTVFARCDHWASRQGVLGFPLMAVQEAFFGEDTKRLVLLDYMALAREPKRTMERLYETIGLEPFEHDFDNVEFGAGDEFDTRLGLPNLHTVAKKVEYKERPTVLPPEIFNRYPRQGFWKRPEANIRKVKIILPEHPSSAEPMPQFPGFGPPGGFMPYGGGPGGPGGRPGGPGGPGGGPGGPGGPRRRRM
jgi:sulfotransferase